MRPVTWVLSLLWTSTDNDGLCMSEITAINNNFLQSFIQFLILTSFLKELFWQLLWTDTQLVINMGCTTIEYLTYGYIRLRIYRPTDMYGYTDIYAYIHVYIRYLHI